MEPTLSLLLLAYNDEKTVIAALESILEQDVFEQNKPIEIIALPNGCTDKTVKLIDQFFHSKNLPKKHKFKSIVIPEGHRNKALNKGIRESRGKLICYMNADCTISKGGLLSICNIYSNDKKVQLASLNDMPVLDHLLQDSLLKGYFEIQIALGEIKGKIVPVGRALSFRRGLIDSVPEDIHSEDHWLAYSTLEKYGPHSVKVIQNEFVYWTPPADWTTYINLTARHFRGPSQLFETYPEILKIDQKLRAKIKRKSASELKEVVLQYLIRGGKTKERAEELFDFYQNIVKIFPEQEKILGRKLIDNKGKWVTDR